jgi:hypothetical protein
VGEHAFDRSGEPGEMNCLREQPTYESRHQTRDCRPPWQLRHILIVRVSDGHAAGVERAPAKRIPRPREGLLDREHGGATRQPSPDGLVDRRIADR